MEFFHYANKFESPKVDKKESGLKFYPVFESWYRTTYLCQGANTGSAVYLDELV